MTTLTKALTKTTPFAVALLISASTLAWDGHAPLVERMKDVPVPPALVDEPDMGMDRNLAASFDPLNERRWMGGTTGPTSQGFRHMYFAGWRASHPLTTFQIPVHPIGQAPNRVQETATDARRLLREKKREEGLRRLAWSAHYLEDLTQPFHAVQVVHWRMVPWSELAAWPPSRGLENLIKETTRTISNYHWAFEGYVAHHVKHGAYDRCLGEMREATLKPPQEPLTSSEYPRELAMAAVEASVELAAELGRAEIEKYGDLKGAEIDLAHDKGKVDYEPRSAALDQVTCKALANAAEATRLLVQWALHP